MDDDDSNPFERPARRRSAVGGRHGPGAMPEDHDAIRIRFEADEPPALVFNETALPGALVSWAWCQLATLDSLLRVLSEPLERGDAAADVVGAVRSVLGPALNALEFSERRAYQIASARRAAPRRRGKKTRRGAARR